MLILFHSDYYKLVCILNKKTGKLAIASYDMAKKYFGENLDKLLESSVEIESLSVNDINNYKYFCNCNFSNNSIEICRGTNTRTKDFYTNTLDTLKGKLKYAIYNEFKSNSLDFGEEDTEVSNDDTKVYDTNCDKCKGLGYYIENGLQIQCNCYEKVKETSKLDKAINIPTKITAVTKENCVSIGLVPEEYSDCKFDSVKILDSINKVGKNIEGFRVVNSDKFMETLNSILIACKTGSKLKYSYLLACDKGLGKNEFVYECIQHLYQRNQTCCRYISLQELGAIRGEYIKQSQALTNLGYYYRDTDRQLLERTIEEEGKNIIRALLKDWISVEPKANSKDLKKSMNLLEKTLLDRIYTKTAQDERLINEYEDVKYRVVNTWEDYLTYPLVFVYFSGSLDRHYETEVLQELLNIRGAKALPTVCLLESSLGIFKDEPTYFDNGKGGTVIDIAKTKSYFWLNMLSNSSCITDGNAIDLDSGDIEYDRMKYINCYIDYKGRLKYSLG